MIHYIIDGNNLIGKVLRLKELQLRDKQQSRSELVAMLNSFFVGKKINLTLHLDGFKNLPLNLSKGKIVYSDQITSDAKIKDEITKSRSPKLITLVTSDRLLSDFARANSCSVIKSEEFVKMMKEKNEKNEEVQKIKDLENDYEYFKKIFTSNDP